LPIGHALCACSATEFFLWQQRMRGALSQLPTASGPWIWRPTNCDHRPAQMNLFEGLQPRACTDGLGVLVVLR